jgi:hypothetical protein
MVFVQILQPERRLSPSPNVISTEDEGEILCAIQSGLCIVPYQAVKDFPLRSK